MAKPTTTPIVVTQQALNLLRQILAAQGWAKTVSHIYVAGKLLTETLPQLESLSWVKTPDEVTALSEKERKAYLDKDKAWVEKPCECLTTVVDRDVIECAFQHFIATAASAKQLGPNQFLSELIEAFKIQDAPAEVKHP